jgi:hypothetical protein
MCIPAFRIIEPLNFIFRRRSGTESGVFLFDIKAKFYAA